MHSEVYIGLGGNLRAEPWGPPQQVLNAALAAIADETGMRVARRSRWYRSPPDPPSGQPWYVNGVIELATSLEPEPLLRRLHAIEARFGRVRTRRDGARILDLDLLAFGDRLSESAQDVILPHPRLHLRAFVLRPLHELSPAWMHPRLRRTAAELLAALPRAQVAIPFDDPQR